MLFNYLGKRLNYPSIVGDGTADDTAALQALVNSQSEIYFPAGLTVKLTGSVTIDTDKCHIFDGGNSTFVVTGDFPAFIVSGSMTGSMTADPTTLTDQILKSEANFVIQNCRITSSSPSVGTGVRVTGCFEPIVTGCYMYKLKTGIALASRNRNASISGNNIYTCSQYGIHAQSSLNLHQCNIFGNHISYCYYCIYAENPNEIANWQIAGNDIEVATYPTSGKANFRAIKITSDNSKSDLLQEIEITGNTIQGHAECASIVEISGGTNRFAQYISIVGNHISNSTGPIVVLSKARCISCCGNTFKGGTYLYSITDCKGVVITAESAYNVTGLKTESGTNTDIVVGDNAVLTS